MRLLPCALIALLPAVAHAADVCVTPTATGDGSGSDWANTKAWTDTPTRGDTWWVADGEYPGRGFVVPEEGATPIAIVKATSAAHGPDTAWTDDLGDGVAHFASSLIFDSSHWILDGVEGGGPGRWGEGFGFAITSMDDAMANVRIGYDGVADDVIVRHVDLEGMGEPSDQGGGYSNDAVAIYGSAGITVSYAWIHGAGRCPFYIDTADSIFEYVWVESYYGTEDVHSEVASIWQFADLPIGDITFRHNFVTHIASTGGLMFDNSSNPAAHLYVHGNVFHHPPGASWDEANGVIGGWTGGNGEEMHNVWVVHNTFVGIDQSSLGTLPEVTSGSLAWNNLWVDSDPPDFANFPTHDFNHFVSSGDAQGEPAGTEAAGGDPFVDAAAMDFLLIANTEPGMALDPSFAVDAYGRPRTTWTRGAYEYCGDGGCDPPPGDTGSDGGVDETTDDDGAGTGSGADGTTTTATDDGTADGDDTDPVGSGGSSGSGGADTGAGGCGCRSEPRATDLPAAIVVMVLARRRLSSRSRSRAPSRSS